MINTYTHKYTEILQYSTIKNREHKNVLEVRLPVTMTVRPVPSIPLVTNSKP